MDRTVFLAMLPKRTAFVQSAGLAETKLESVETNPLDDRYTLARVVWIMLVKKPGHPDQCLRTRATYLLLGSEDGFRVVAQIDHQDLMAELNALERT